MTNNEYLDRYEDFCLAFFMELRDNYHYKLTADQLLSFLKISNNIDITDENALCMNMQMFFCHQASEIAHFPEIFHAFYCSDAGQAAIAMTHELKKTGVKNKNVFLQKNAGSASAKNKVSLSLPNFKCERFFAQFELMEGICEYSSYIHAAYLNLYDDYIRHIDDLDDIDKGQVFDSIYSELSRFVSYCKKTLSDPEDFVRKTLEISSIFQSITQKPSDEGTDETDATDEEPQETTEYLPQNDDRIPMPGDYTKKDIRLLTKKDMEEIKRYIKENAHKLKGRVNRNLKKAGRREFDAKKTVKDAFHTGMIPIYLSFKNPKPRKVKIVCFLDISPSCITAATVLIHLLHALEKAFGGGVEIFNFTDQAHKITPMVRTHTVADCVSTIVADSKGTVSDYSLAFESFNSNHYHELRKNTIFLILGDMKNNYRRFNKETLAKIHSRVAAGKGKVILLHTDPKRRWYKDDSILKSAEKYIDEIYEIKNVDDILHFLSVLTL